MIGHVAPLALLAALAAVSAHAGIIEVTCDQDARAHGWCYSEQEGKTITVFSVAVVGPVEAQCPHDKASDPECQAARLLKALSPGWQPTVTCAQPLVDAGVCHRTFLGKRIGNPMGRRQFADRELRLALWNMVSQGWRSEEEALIGPAPPLLMDGKAPP